MRPGPDGADAGKASSVLLFWIVAGWVGFLLLPWYMVDGGLWTFEWLTDGYPFDDDYAPAAFLIAQGEKLWLAPLLIPLAHVRLDFGKGRQLAIHSFRRFVEHLAHGDHRSIAATASYRRVS